MAVQPRSFLVVGSLMEFQGEHGANADRYRSFEDYRRNLRHPEILTFDELYERARFIVEISDPGQYPAQESETEADAEIPY